MRLVEATAEEVISTARRRFDPEFRKEAVRIVRETGEPIAKVARELGINAGTLADWVNKDRIDRRDQELLKEPAVEEFAGFRGLGDDAPSLVVVGTGIRTVGQLTLEAIAWMRKADALLYGVGDPVAEEVAKRLNPDGAVSLSGYYREGAPRMPTYEAMIEHIMGCVRADLMTVAAFYGHPGVFAYPSHEAIRRARREGFEACMLPGISSEDCLYADLGVDPAVGGCQSYEATDFLLNERQIDPAAQLVLWQVGTLGDYTYRRERYDLRAFPLLVQRLSQFFPLSHIVVPYQAPVLPGAQPMVQEVPLGYLSEMHVNAATTLYVPPYGYPRPNLQTRMSFQGLGGQIQ